MAPTWKLRSGNKILSRNFLANGNFTGKPRGYKAHRVASLVGFDISTGIGAMCIQQGINFGYIAPDAEVYAIERDSALAEKLRETLDQKHTVFECAFSDFIPPRKLDLMNLDLMETTSHSIGQKLVADIVPMMASRRSGLGINVNIQRVCNNKAFDDFRDIYMSDRPYWNDIWRQLRQAAVIDPHNPHDPDTPFTGVVESGMDSLLSFVGIHHYMRQTDFQYRGCFRYFERSSEKAGPQYMLSLRYERGK